MATGLIYFGGLNLLNKQKGAIKMEMLNNFFNTAVFFALLFMIILIIFESLRKKSIVSEDISRGNCYFRVINNDSALEKKIYIFKNTECDGDVEEVKNLRQFLVNNSVNRIILIYLRGFFKKIIDNYGKIENIDEIRLIEENNDNLPIIFCGLDYNYFESFLLCLEWEERFDMEWIENPYNIDELKGIIEQMEEY